MRMLRGKTASWDPTASGVTPTYLGWAETSGAGGGATTLNLTVGMSGHNGSDKVVVAVGGITASGAATNLSSATLDGNAHATVVSLPSVSANGAVLGYLVFNGTSFAASSTLALTFSVGVLDCGAALWAVPSASTIATLASQGESTRTGSDVSGNVSAGDGVIAAQIQINGSNTATWTGVTDDGETDVRTNEWMTWGSAGDVSPAIPMTVTCTGAASIPTSAISIKVSP